jgi:hypothetical protein
MIACDAVKMTGLARSATESALELALQTSKAWASIKSKESTAATAN